MTSRWRGLLAAVAGAGVALGLAAAPAAGHGAEPGAAPDTATDTATAAATPRQATPAQETVAAMQPGWNLGNSLDATGDDETSWGNPRITRELIAGVKDKGFNSIRIPVTWYQHQGDAPDYAIDADHLARVQEVVDWALAEDLYVLINLHHDSWNWVHRMPGQHDAVLERFTATWTQIAEAFRDAPPDRLLFESINEPQFEGAADEAQELDLSHELNTTFHAVVRDSGGNNADRLLVLPTLHTSAERPYVDQLAATFAELDDPNLAATVHYYGFWPFSVNIAGYTTFDEESRADLTGAMDRVHDAFVAQGIPVIVGEYGLLGMDVSLEAVEHGETLKFFELFGSYARQQGLTTMWWDNGQHLNRTTLEWSDPSLFEQIRSSWTTDSATASTDQVFVRAGQDPEAATLTLNPNGNSLVAVLDGTEELARGEDYTVDGDQLTLAADTLARLTAGGGLGVTAVLTLEFDGGVPWEVNVIRHDTAEMADATGTTTDGLVIPTAFNGDRVATMEAVYADGSYAGPQDWTPYKQYGYAFAPDHAAGETTMTADFFAEVRDDATVHLTFHFWSGATLEYTLTVSGSTVTGTAATD